MSPPSTLSEKLEWRIREYTARLRYWMVRNGLLTANRDYEPFIILCDIRTGSTMLTSFLKGHPDTLMFFELFHVDRSSVPFQVDGFRGKAQTEEIVKMRNTDPVQFLEQEVFQAYPAHLDAVGFKLLYTQARSRRMWWDEPKYSDWWEHMDESRKAWRNADSDLWSYLRSRTDIKIIHLIRENLLRQKLSARLAKATNKWGVGATGGIDRSGEKPSVSLNPELCKRDFAAKERMQREAERDFKDHDVLRTSYEKILDAPLEELARIQRFLGLRVEPLHAETEKQGKRPLEEAISNYSELRSQMTGTPWEHFFVETDPGQEIDDAA